MVGKLAASGSSGSIIIPPAGITGVSVQLMAEIEVIHYKPCKIKYNIPTGPSEVTYHAPLVVFLEPKNLLQVEPKNKIQVEK